MAVPEGLHPHEIVIEVPHAYASRKAAHWWSAAGMSPEARARWLDALTQAVLQHVDRLSDWLQARTRLEARTRIFGPKRSIDPLDVHEALADIIDSVTNVVSPRAPGRRTPQWQDRFYWRVSAEKLVAEVGRVEIHIEPIGDANRAEIARNLPARDVDQVATEAFHEDLLASGLVRTIKSPTARSKDERPLVSIQGPPLSQTIVEDRR